MDSIGVNDILKDLTTNELVRILYINVEKNAVALIRLDADAEMPFWMDYQELRSEFECRGYVHASDDECARYEPASGDWMTEKQKKVVDTLAPLFRKFEASKPECFLSHGKREFIALLRATTGQSQSACRRRVHNYWARGGGDQALIPLYNRRGRKPKRYNPERG